MEGPYNLIESEIDSQVSVEIGTYILVNIGNVAIYVGRSDTNLNSRLKEHLQRNEINSCIRRSDVNAFYFEITQSLKDAYILECNWYHKYKPTCNIAHPNKSSIEWECPICGL